MRVVGITSSPAKCAYLTNELGVDIALDYKSPKFKEEFDEKVGKADVYYDNVGGEMLDFMLTKLNMRARIVICGKSFSVDFRGLRA